MPRRYPLDVLHIASPCSADWSKMNGDDRVRFCDECGLNVYHLSGMARAEAEAVIAEHDGERLCVRLFRRRDGTVLTADCPVGVAMRAQRARRVIGWCVAWLFCVSIMAAVALFHPSKQWARGPGYAVVERMRQFPITRPVIDWLYPMHTGIVGDADEWDPTNTGL